VGVTNPREVLGLRLWLVSHEVITRGSPLEQFEICGIGTHCPEIWFPKYGGHVTDRHSNVAREAHGGFESLLALRLRPLSSKATHPPNYRSLHRLWA